MCDRRSEDINANSDDITLFICNNLGIDGEKALFFHLEKWIYVHGVATMIATSYLDWQNDFVSSALTDAYMGLRLRYLEESDESD